jgi:hypothetical protein
MAQAAEQQTTIDQQPSERSLQRQLLSELMVHQPLTCRCLALLFPGQFRCGVDG